MGVDRIREGWEHSKETEGEAKVTLESSGYSVSEGVWKHDRRTGSVEEVTKEEATLGNIAQGLEE